MTVLPHSATLSQGCILFADIVGSTGLYETLGDVAALTAVTAVIDLLSGIVRQHDGDVVKTLGDELMAFFPEPVAAYVAATMMLETIGQSQFAGQRTVRLRIGLHHGRVLHADNGDWFGDTVNTASRLVKLCKPDQALCSAEVAAVLPSSFRSSIRSLGAFALKGKQSDCEVFEVLPLSDGHRTTLHAMPSVQQAVQILRLQQGECLFVVDRHHPRLRVGRAADNDLVCDQTLVSRYHLLIEFRRDRFVLVDESTNGTWVRFRMTREIRLLREQLPLVGSGAIALGCSPDQCDPHQLLLFSIESEQGVGN